MAFCRYCKAAIDWAHDEIADRWFPLKEGTDELHSCGASAESTRASYERVHRRGYDRGYQAGRLMAEQEPSAAALKDAREGGYKDGYASGWLAGRMAHEEARGLLSGALTLEEINALIRLTHPDRHPAERQAEANRLTARLLEMRGKK